MRSHILCSFCWSSQEFDRLRFSSNSYQVQTCFKAVRACFLEEGEIKKEKLSIFCNFVIFRHVQGTGVWPALDLSFFRVRARRGAFWPPKPCHQWPRAWALCAVGKVSGPGCFIPSVPPRKAVTSSALWTWPSLPDPEEERVDNN